MRLLACLLAALGLFVAVPQSASAQTARDCTRLTDASRRDGCEARAAAESACRESAPEQRRRCIDANYVAPPQPCERLNGRLRTDCEFYRVAHAACSQSGRPTRACIDARWEPKLLAEPLNPLDCPSATGPLAERCAARGRAVSACEQLPPSERAGCRNAYTRGIDLRDCPALSDGRGRCALANRGLEECRARTGQTLITCLGDAAGARNQPAVACRDSAPTAVRAYCVSHDRALESCLPRYADPAAYRACVEAAIPVTETAAARVSEEIERRSATVDALRKLGPVR